MAFQHKQLAQMLEYRFGSHPAFGQGIRTVNNQLVTFPVAIGPFPTDLELAQWVAEYEALTPVEKDPRLKRKSRLSKINTIAELKQFIEEDLL